MRVAERIGIVIADDHFLVREGLRATLRNVAGAEVVGEAVDGNELLALALELQPALVITDITMPGQDGLSVLSLLRQRLPRTRVLVVSMHDTPHLVRKAVQHGAHGYLLKGGPPMELEHAVRTLLGGQAYFSPQVTQQLLAPDEPNAEDVLTERQLDILKQLATGMSSKEIAFKLGLSSKTVDVHRARIMERLQLGDVVSLSLYCVRQGLINPAELRQLRARR